MLPRPIAELALRFATRGQGRYKSSSQQSLERGESTEVDFLNGRIVLEATARSLASPWNAAIVSMVHAIEVNQARAGLESVEELTRRAT
ncbi:MAG: hypothetical protein JO133_08880 [Burkholderiaceae bacterium]|nr:hypothetical protein [Burkholderiaceae bacterium]